MPAPKTKPAPEITDAALRELYESALAGYPEGWIPENKGDVIAGTFIRLEIGRTAFGPAPLVVLKTEDGTERSVWILHEALKTQFNRIRPATGDSIVVVYLGKEKVKNPSPGRAKEYHNWRVTSDKVSTEAAWDILGTQENLLTDDGGEVDPDADGTIPY